MKSSEVTNMLPVVASAMAQLSRLWYDLRLSPTSIDSLLSGHNRLSAYKMDMDGPNNHNQEGLVDMAPDGDCILVVGPDMVKLRVHSLSLRAASKPFSAMFTPEWKEGDTLLSQSRPIEILLPEDDATGMRLVCAIIHHKNQEVPANLSAHNVLGVAITADKYDFVHAVKSASDNWLRNRKDEASDLIALAAAAYLLRNENAFKEITKRMILTHSGRYYDLCSEEVGSVMDWKVFCERFRKDSVFYWLTDVKACWKKQEVSQG
jgi:hypothetical protein